MESKKAFVEKYRAAATKAAHGSRIHPYTIITVAALESGYGKSLLASKHNNFFGRKPEKGYTGPTVTLNTAEYIDGKRVIIPQVFKKYPTPEAGFLDYVRLLSRSDRYGKVRAKTTPQEQFVELQKAGYATNPRYAAKLTRIYSELAKYTPTLALLAIGTLAFIYLTSN